MEPEIETSPIEQPVRGYQRAAVDEFLAAAADERARLQALIAEADDRADRARAAVGMHQVMVAMLVETQEELTRRRRDADQDAREIIAAADAHALAIEQAPVVTAPEALSVAPAPMAMPAAVTVEPAPPAEPVVEAPAVAEPVASAAPRLRTEGGDDEEADRFIAFLRRALDDQEPLGPRPETSV